MPQTLPKKISDLPDDPLTLYGLWKEEARKTEINDPSACCLATVDKNGHPHARMVLVKSFDPRGFNFHTNADSDKGREMQICAHVALCFHWKSLRRQVRVEGAVEETAPKEADAYFASRSRESRLGAWASQQSRPLERYEDLIAAHDRYAAEFKDRDDIPRPPYWKGFRVVPEKIEFWIDGDHRLHRRFVYTRGDDGAWTVRMLYP